MIKALGNYITQRINLGLWLSLSAFLMLYSVPVFPLTMQIVLTFIWLFCALLVFRLYDDLRQTIHDTGKPNRDYASPATGKELWRANIILMAVLAGSTFLMKPEAGSMLLCFMIVNHLLYLLLIKNKVAAGLLPLLKYPLLYFLLRLMLTSAFNMDAIGMCQALALFLAFFAFEVIEDKTYPVANVYSYLLQFLSFGFIFVEHVAAYTALAGVVLLVLSLAFNYLQWKIAPYLFLLFLLVFKLSIYVKTTL